MNSSDIETYEYQLSQIKLALAKDPTNTEYLTLQEELTSLIELTREYLSTHTAASTSSSTAPAATTSAPTPAPKPSSSKPAAPAAPRPNYSFKSGDEILARYSGDGKFYPARITSIGGSDENRVYSVVFQGYESTELVSSGDVKPINDPVKAKRALELSAEEQEKERKRKKNEKKAETKQVKTAEQGQRQKSWQSFAKKGAKKGVVIPGISGGSMFRSPEDLNPNAKVGVVGSGKGMTKASERKRQTFRDGLDEA